MRTFYNNINTITVQATSSDLYSIYTRKPLTIMSIMKFLMSVHSDCSDTILYSINKIFNDYYNCFYCFIKILYECSSKLGYEELVESLLTMYYFNNLITNYSILNKLNDIEFTIKTVDSFIEMFRTNAKMNNIDFVKFFRNEHDVQALMFFMMKMFFVRNFHIIPEFSVSNNRFDIIVSFKGVSVGIELKYIIKESRIEFLRSINDQVHKYLSSSGNINYLYIIIIYDSSNNKISESVSRIVKELQFENLYEKRFKVISVPV